MMFSINTPAVIRNTPAHANSCQFVNGLSAKLKIITGRFAMGFIMSLFQNWFDSAVNNNGAVSPAIRATPNKMPVKIPAELAFTVMAITIFLRGIFKGIRAMGLKDAAKALEAAAGETVAFPIALDGRTGKTIWQVDVPAGKGEAFSKGVNVALHEDWKEYTGSHLDEGFLIDY